MLIISFMLVILILFFNREWYYKDKLDADTVYKVVPYNLLVRSQKYKGCAPSFTSSP